MNKNVNKITLRERVSNFWRPIRLGLYLFFENIQPITFWSLFELKIFDLNPDWKETIKNILKTKSSVDYLRKTQAMH